MHPPTLSLCLIVKNEAANLPRCLESAAGVVDEIVVVDTGSTDETVAIAERFGARVLHHAWQNDFALARNVGLDAATGEWILHLDADEELEAESARRLKPFLAQVDADGVLVQLQHKVSADGLTDLLESSEVRLFRNRPHHRFEMNLHTQILPSIQRHGGRVVPSEFKIWHYGYLQTTAQGGVDRGQRNLALLEEAVARSPNDAYSVAKLGQTHFLLGNDAIAEAHLLRLWRQLDIESLNPAVLSETLAALAAIAERRGDWHAACEYAHCGLALDANPNMSLPLRLIHARAQAGLAESKLELIQGKILSEAEPLSEAGLLEEATSGLRSAMELLAQAQADYDLILAQPNLRRAVAPEIRQARSEAAQRQRFAERILQNLEGGPIRYPTLSLCLIVKNEAANLPRCLESAAGVVDEIVVVDTGSTDETVAIAERFGARVLHHAWQNDFALARNVGLDAATGEWLLVLDADEALPPETRAKLKRTLWLTEADALQVTVRNFMPEDLLVTYKDFPSFRLCRNRPEYRYSQRIHEQILPALERHGARLEPADLLIWHYGYAQSAVQGDTQRAARDRALLEQAVAVEPDNAYFNYQLGALYLRENELTLAEIYLRRALLFQERLGQQALALTLRLLAELALHTQHYERAVAYAEASQATLPQDDDAYTLNTWATAHRHLGQRYAQRTMDALEAALAESQTGAAEHTARAQAELDQSRLHFEQAYLGFLSLRQRTDLNLALVSSLDAELDYCRRMLGEAA
jgi:glycosyltransferase involved in cell wall biosynthesis